MWKGTRCEDGRRRMGIHTLHRRTLNRLGQFRDARRRLTIFGWFGRYFGIDNYVIMDLKIGFGTESERLTCTLVNLLKAL